MPPQSQLDAVFKNIVCLPADQSALFTPSHPHWKLIDPNPLYPASRGVQVKVEGAERKKKRRIIINLSK